jgi:zinc finger SWIM domain-containing protein 3
VADLRSSQGDPKVLFSDMLKQAAGIYTPSIYKIFESEYYLFLNCSVRDNGQCEKVHEYIVTNGGRERIVRHDLLGNNITCTCLKFEFMGIQCCHVIKVLDFMNIKQLPERYFLRRWRKDAKKGKKVFIPEIEIESESEVNLAQIYSSMMQTFGTICFIASQSEKACKYLLQVTQEVMRNVEEIISKENRGYQKDYNQAPRNVTPNFGVEATSKQPTGILKKDGGKGRRRYQSSLEKNKKRRKTG